MTALRPIGTRNDPATGAVEGGPAVADRHIASVHPLHPGRQSPRSCAFDFRRGVPRLEVPVYLLEVSTS